MQVSGVINLGILGIDSDGREINRIFPMGNKPMSEVVRDSVCSLILFVSRPPSPFFWINM